MSDINAAVQQLYNHLQAEPNKSGCLIPKRGWFTDRNYHMHRPNGSKKPVRTHRYAYILQNGPLLKHECACHSCDNPSCINIDHIWIGSQKDNMRDMIAKGRKVTRRGSKSVHAKITRKHVIAIRSLDGLVSQSKIADLFGISQGQISRIIRKEKWAHV